MLSGQIRCGRCISLPNDAGGCAERGVFPFSSPLRLHACAVGRYASHRDWDRRCKACILSYTALGEARARQRSKHAPQNGYFGSGERVCSDTSGCGFTVAFTTLACHVETMESVVDWVAIRRRRLRVHTILSSVCGGSAPLIHMGPIKVVIDRPVLVSRQAIHLGKTRMERS